MATGRIKNLVRDRGFGFIQVDGASDDLFFHSSTLSGVAFDDLKEGQTVEFEAEADPRNQSRKRASQVRLSDS